jgi:hypothetical protein
MSKLIVVSNRVTLPGSGAEAGGLAVALVFYPLNSFT